jgi:hypothetical protein
MINQAGRDKNRERKRGGEKEGKRGGVYIH